MADSDGINTQDLVAETMSNLSDTAPDEEYIGTDQLEYAEEEGYQEESLEEEFVPEPEPEPEPEPTAQLDEAFMQLAEYGINFGVRKSDLPPELHSAYDNLAGEALTAVQTLQSELQNMHMAQAEMRQFAQKLEQDPQKILLTMAVTKPEAFQEVVQAYEEMQHDERYRNMVIRELQAEAKLSAAERQQQVWQQRQMEQKVKVVTTATHRAAQKYGVDSELAERYVAMQIQANGGDIDPRQVDNVIAQLKPKGPQVAPVQKVQKAQQAPNQSVQGRGTSGPTPGVRDEASPGLTRASHNPFMDLVKNASRRARTGE